VGALAAHLGANVINDVFDFGAGADQTAQAIMPQGNTVVALGEKGARIVGAIILLLLRYLSYWMCTLKFFPGILLLLPLPLSL
jgi:1,4-dihydroxy-2-naphthoate octaprenyltransferase